MMVAQTKDWLPGFIILKYIYRFSCYTLVTIWLRGPDKSLDMSFLSNLAHSISKFKAHTVVIYHFSDRTRAHLFNIMEVIRIEPAIFRSYIQNKFIIFLLFYSYERPTRRCNQILPPLLFIFHNICVFKLVIRTLFYLQINIEIFVQFNMLFS